MTNEQTVVMLSSLKHNIDREIRNFKNQHPDNPDENTKMNGFSDIAELIGKQISTLNMSSLVKVKN